MRPYEYTARAYFSAGWSPLPLPPRSKTWPPVGYTGFKGRPAEPEKVEHWIATKGDGNVALRMPPNMVGIDVDNYGGKAGAATLAAAEAEWGPLPATWRTTSRTDGVSGIRLFRIPEGLQWPGKLPQGGGVELCPWTHRYVIVAPSIHEDTGQQYHWFSPAGNQTTGSAVEQGDWEFPALDDLPMLPQSWIDGLTAGRKYEEHAEADLDPEEVKQWILDRPDGALCEKMQRTLDLWMAKISGAGEDGGVHDNARDGSWAVMRDAAAGHTGLQKALQKIMLAHKEGLRNRRPEKSATEWASIKARGVRKVAAEGPTDEDDPCVMSEVSRSSAKRNRGSGGMDFTRDDTGNGRRFALQWRDEVRWVPATESWVIWRDKVWEPDVDGEIMRMATKTVSDMARELEFIEDAKEKTAFRKFIRSSSNEGKLKSMLNMAKTNRGITVQMERFDANASHLVVANGTLSLPLEFSDAGVKRIASLPEHLNTRQASVAYISGKTDAYWDKFLDRFQPNPEIRAWLQRLAGYSLLGSNPRRLMIAAIGETSTGKSTFVEAVSAALGDYAGSTSMTIFRDNQDERARPDLLRVLPMRFVYAEEASRSWHLHPDQIKRLTGGTHLQARTLHTKTYADKVPSFTPWLVTNNPPTIEGADAALRRRILVVPFDIEIPKAEEDATFRARLIAEEGRQAILAWLVEGYQAYLAEPESLQEVPLPAVEANLKFWNEISDLSVCLSDICDFDPEFVLAPSQLYKAYQIWCGENGVVGRDVMSSTKFGREVASAHPKRMMTVDGKPLRMRTGLRLKEGWCKIVTG